MPRVVQAKCPKCKTLLRIPADWLTEAVRCKHCGAVIQAKPKPETSKLPEPVSPPASISPAPATNFAEDATPLAELAQSPAGDAPIVRAPAIRRPSNIRRAAILAVLLTLVIGLTWFGWRNLEQLRGRLFPNEAESIDEADRDKRTVSVAHLGSAAFPRRLLAICVTNYIYMNPVSYGEGGEQNFHTLTERISRVLHIAPSQVVELSDAAAPRPAAPSARPGERKKKSTIPRPASVPLPLPALKSVLEKTITEFLQTSRAQDRIILIFLGHAVEIGDEAYLVPLEGEPAVKETLIPVKWLYDQLRTCKARQKILLLDTCRLDPGRGFERPGSGPMGEKLDALLAKPPEGVEVWSACTGQQYSHEQEGGSVFLEKLFGSLASEVIKKIQEPEDPLPVDPLAAAVNKGTTALVADRWQAKQTPRLCGHEAREGAPYDRAEALPAKIETSLPSPAAGGVAKQADVQCVLSEIELPPIKPVREATAPLALDTLIPFSALVLQNYRTDYASLKEFESSPEKYPLRVAVLEAVKLLRHEFNRASDAFSLQDSFPGANSESLKKEILRRQMRTARIMARLRETADNLRKVGEERERESSQRWQAHYDYIMAEVLARIAYVVEYDLMLGKIRKDELPMPESGPAPTGWRLASREKLASGKEAKEPADECKKIFAKLIKKHKGTPWEILAKRDRLTALGLEWQPLR